MQLGGALLEQLGLLQDQLVLGHVARLVGVGAEVAQVGCKTNYWSYFTSKLHKTQHSSDKQAKEHKRDKKNEG